MDVFFFFGGGERRKRMEGKSTELIGKKEKVQFMVSEISG